jgi:hypothetical protein
MTISAWTALTVKALNDDVAPVTYNGYFYRASNVGSSPHKTGAVEPSWGTVVGGTTADGDITWTCYDYSQRHRIMQAVKTRFQAILKSGGYATNLGQAVKEWRDPPLPSGSADTLIIKDSSCNSASSTTGSTQYQEHILDVHASLITGSSASLTPAELRMLIADLQKAIGVDPTWGGLAKRTLPAGDEFTIEHADKIVGEALFKFKIVFRTKSWDPFNQ